MFISESIIHEIAETMDDVHIEPLVDDFADAQPAILAYIFSEDMEALSENEREYLLGITIIIWKAIEKVAGEIEEASSKEIEDAEEHNWELLESSPDRRFRDRLNVFFKDYKQEDLLAFAEDALVEDDDSPVTSEGREPMMVALKSVIDVLTANLP